MKSLGIDIETYSSAELPKTGVYKYVEAPDFEILLIAYQYDNEPVQIVDLTEFDFPYDLKQHLTNPNILKTAWNANFERTSLAKYLNLTLDPSQWSCTMAYAAQLSLPLQLEQAAAVLKLPAQKDAAGKALIKYFSMPCKPSAKNGMRTRNLPSRDLEKWEKFKAYCVQDVVVEQSIRNKISFFKVPETEIKLWNLDQRINDTGILLDATFAKNAIEIDEVHRQRLTEEAIELTGLENPNSVSQLKEWISKEIASEVTTLNKETVPALLEGTDCETVTRVLNIRQEMSKTSVKKYTAMINAVCSDNRVRGLLQYYGANRTGRWAGRLVQVQNLPQNKIKDLDFARKLVKENDLEMLEMLFDNVPEILSQLIRTAFVAPPGHRFIVADFSAIEARVIAWLAGEKWRLDVFNSHGKIYEASASQMFKIPLEKITKDLRQKGKVSELALGYQGGPGALLAMGALKMGLTEEELPELVNRWRNANKMIVDLWRRIENCAIGAVENDGMAENYKGVLFYKQKGALFIELPSGRCLTYMRPVLKPGHNGRLSLVYEGMNQTTKQWQKIDTYGGKLVENIVQAIARDCLADAMLRLDNCNFKIAIHVHDEVVLEVPYEDKRGVEYVNSIMSTPIPWAKGLPLKAESFETEFYKKD